MEQMKHRKVHTEITRDQVQWQEDGGHGHQDYLDFVGPLVFAHFIQVIQCEPRIQQRRPTVEAGARGEQLALPVVQLARQLAVRQ